MNTNKPFAEVIESSLHTITAQSWQWDSCAPFGTLVAINQAPLTIFGVVYQIQTGSMDPTRYPFAYQKTEAELRAEQPQIFEFLRTTVACLIIGYQEKSRLLYQLAPVVCKIHTFVQQASPEQTKQFLSHERYLHLLFAQANLVGNLDELLLSMLKEQSRINGLCEQKLEQFIHTYSLLCNDYRRVKLFLERAQLLL